MRKFRILHTESSRGLGGQEYRIVAEAKGMGLRGHHVVIAAPKDSPLIAYAREEGVQCEGIPVGILGWGRLVPVFLKLILEYQIQVVHTHGSQDSWTASVAGRLSSLKPIIIRSRHKSTPISQTWRHQWLYKYLAHGVMTTSEQIRKDIISRQAVDPMRAFSVPTGVDLSIFNPEETTDDLRNELGIPRESIVLGTVAFLRTYKGLHLCLEAVRWLRHRVPSIRFLVVGDGPERFRLQEQAKTLGIQSQVLFLGFRSDVHRVLATLDIFVLPSTEAEGVPQAITQAMAMNIPVVASSTGGIPEVVEHESTGLLVPVRDSRLLRENLFTLIEDKYLRVRLGKRGRESIVSSYSCHAMLDNIEGMYASLWQREKRDTTAAG